MKTFLVNLSQIAAVAVVSFVFFFFIIPNQPGRGGAIAVCVIGEGMAIKASWRLRNHGWFWITIGVISAVQGLLIFEIPSPTGRFPGLILVPLGFADFAIVYGLVKLVDKLIPKKDGEHALH